MKGCWSRPARTCSFPSNAIAGNGPRPIARGGAAGVSAPGRARAKRALGAGENGRRSHPPHGDASQCRETPNKLVKPKPSLSVEVGAKAARKLKARRNAAHGVWPGDDGADRLVGGDSDAARRGARSGWTGTIREAFLDAGAAGGRLAIGCLNAWHWVAKEDKAMRDEQRMTMNEVLRWCWRCRRACCSARFSSAAFGGRFARAFRPSSRRCGSSAACCCG